MTKGRKTTYEERIAFVKECIENGCNYTEIAFFNRSIKLAISRSTHGYRSIRNTAKTP